MSLVEVYIIFHHTIYIIFPVIAKWATYFCMHMVVQNLVKCLVKRTVKYFRNLLYSSRTISRANVQLNTDMAEYPR
jgi:hypothetical protein